MNDDAKYVAIVAIIAVVVVIAFYFVWDRLYRHDTVNCTDGSHPAIDMRDFSTQYWTYSIKLEGNVADKAKVSAELDPKTLQQISEALQEAREFRKYVVAGYNSCGLTQAQYEQLGRRFHVLDGLARQIDSLLSKPSLSPDERSKLAGLIDQYSDLAGQLGKQL